MTKKNVMIVETDRLLAEDLALTLQEMGYGVCARLTTGEAAVERVSLGDIGTVIMDIKLDSIKAAVKIHAIVDIPLILLTACANDDLCQALRTGS